MLPLADIFGLHHPERLQRERNRSGLSHREVKGHLSTDFTHLQGVQPPSIQEDGKTDKVAVLGHNLCKTKSLKWVSSQSTSCFMSHGVVYRPLTRSSDENSLQSSLRWSTILVPGRTPEASAISNTPELQTHKTVSKTWKCDSFYSNVNVTWLKIVYYPQIWQKQGCVMGSNFYSFDFGFQWLWTNLIIKIKRSCRITFLHFTPQT